MYKIIGADGKEYGPVSAELVRQWLSEGRVNAQTRVLPEGAAEWKTVGELPEFAAQSTPDVPPTLAPLPPSGGTQPQTNPLALTGFILGIVSVTFSLCCYGLPFNLVGIVLSAIALAQIRADPQRQGGKGLAIAGLVLSLFSIILSVIWLILALSLGLTNPMHRIHRL